jgi:hypothetical protein
MLDLFSKDHEQKGDRNQAALQHVRQEEMAPEKQVGGWKAFKKWERNSRE